LKRVSKISASVKEQVSEINNERITLSKLKHSSIVAMKAAWADKDHYYLVFDFALHGDLNCFLKKHNTISAPLAKYFSA
jgi:serine/threonine protein kinase